MSRVKPFSQLTMILVLVWSVLFHLASGRYVSRFVDSSQTIPVVFTCVVDDAKTSLQCTLEAQIQAWLAVGYSPQQTMVGTNAYIATPGSGVSWHQITDASLDGLGSALPLASGASGSVFQNSTHTVLKFSQPYTTKASSSSFSADSTGASQLSYAIGYSNALTDDGHQQEACFDINFLTGKVEEVAPPEPTWVIVHAGLMVFSWALLFPIGALFPRLLRTVLRSVFQVKSLTSHRNVQLLGFFCVLGAFILSVKNVAEHFKGTHQILGLIAVVLMTLQVLLAFVANNKFVHRFIGYVVLAVSAVTIYFGLKNHLKNNTHIHHIFVISTIAAYAFSVLVFLLAGCNSLKQNRAQQSKTDQHEPLLQEEA
jgi:hypothetical protein